MLTPANLGMLVEVARGLRVASVQVSTNLVATLSQAIGCCTLKSMDAALLNILDGWNRFEEHVNR